MASLTELDQNKISSIAHIYKGFLSLVSSKNIGDTITKSIARINQPVSMNEMYTVVTVPHYSTSGTKSLIRTGFDSTGIFVIKETADLFGVNDAKEGNYKAAGDTTPSMNLGWYVRQLLTKTDLPDFKFYAIEEAAPADPKYVVTIMEGKLTEIKKNRNTATGVYEITLTCDILKYVRMKRQTALTDA